MQLKIWLVHLSDYGYQSYYNVLRKAVLYRTQTT